MCRECENLKERIEALEKIITPNSLTLVNKQDPNERYVLIYDGELSDKKITTTEVSVTLNESEGM